MGDPVDLRARLEAIYAPECHALRERVVALRQQNEALRQALDAIDLEHQRIPTDPDFCTGCTTTWPCATSRIVAASSVLGEEPDEGSVVYELKDGFMTATFNEPAAPLGEEPT